ncbi:MAG: thioredoxin [Rhodanobacter sp.]
MSKHIDAITDATLDSEVIEAGGAVLVDFWAEWCGPCKALGPVLDDIADDYLGTVRICKINADENKVSAERFSVRGLPTMILFVDGVERERITGLVSKTRLAAALDAHTEV